MSRPPSNIITDTRSVSSNSSHGLVSSSHQQQQQQQRDYYHDNNSLTMLSRSKPSLMHGYHNPYGSNGQQQSTINMQAAFMHQKIAAAVASQTSLNEDNLKKTAGRQQLILSNNNNTVNIQSGSCSTSANNNTTNNNNNNNTNNNQIQKQSASGSSLPEVKKDSISYVPMVEAISPTPDDQKENTHLQEYKSRIISDLNHVEKELNCSDYQVQTLKRKLIEIEEAHNKPVEIGEKSSPVTLGEKIYTENRVSVMSSDSLFFF